MSAPPIDAREDVPVVAPAEPFGEPPSEGFVRRWVVPVVPCFLVGTLVLGLVMWFAITHLERLDIYPVPPKSFTGSGVLEGWFRYDGGWYDYIARNGYSDYKGVDLQSSVAFYPAYPLAMRAVGSLLGGDVILAGILISWATGLASVMLCFRWLCGFVSRGTATVAVVALLVYPYAWFLYGAVYADCLFLVCTLAAFLLVERDRPVLAGLAAAVATATRPVGGAVVLGLVAVLAERRGIVVLPAVERWRARGRHPRRRSSDHDRAAERDAERAGDGVAVAAGAGPDDRGLSAPSTTGDAAPGADAIVATGTRHPRFVGLGLRRLRWRDAGVLLSLVGAGSWMAYQARTWGSPFVSTQIQQAEGWDQGQGPATWFKLRLVEDVTNLRTWVLDVYRHHIDTPTYHPWYELAHTGTALLQGTFTMVAVLLLPRVLRRFGWGYTLYCVALLAIVVLGTRDFNGGGRYLMAAFPVFGAAGEWLSERARVTQLLLGCASTVLLVVFAGAFARGYYLS